MSQPKPRVRRTHQEKLNAAAGELKRSAELAAQRMARRLHQLEKYETAGKLSDRKRDTRRKIIAGSFALAEKDPAFRRRLWATLEAELTTARDRELFGLPPLPEEGDAAAAPQAA